MKALLVVVLCAAMIAAAAPTTAKERVGTIVGIVLDADGNPAGGARITIQESGNGEHPHAIQAGPDGRFSFERISVGGYDLRAYFQGVWSDWLRNAVVRADRETTLTLRMPPSLTN
jgi:hypothetical protein